jgi:hypothetical protein
VLTTDKAEGEHILIAVSDTNNRLCIQVIIIRYTFQESVEGKTGGEDVENESLPSPQQETVLQTDEGTDTLEHAKETIEIQEPQLAIMIEEEVLLANWHKLSDIAESELWEAHQWPDTTTDDVICPEDKSEEMLMNSISPADVQTSESTVSTNIRGIILYY